MREAIKNSDNAETMYVKNHVKSYAKQKFQKICFFTYSPCGFNNNCNRYRQLKISRWSKKYKRITFLQISYVILGIKAQGV